MNRNDKILCSIDRSMRILELGPLTNPIAPKSDGWLTTVVDYVSREELDEKYRNDSSVDTSLIGEVDIVWSHGGLEAAVPRELHGIFDAFIASHVFEHIPDPIGLLRSLEQVLRPDGVVSLAIPDKRVCFDFFRPLSTAGGLLDAHARKPVRHSGKALFDSVAYAVRADGESAFSHRRVRNIDFAHSLEQAKALFDAFGVAEDAPYADVHGWVFTPASFALAMLELSALNAIDFTVVRSFPTDGCEFFVTLRRGRVDHGDTDVLQARRLKLLRRTLEELREQAEMLDKPKASPTSRGRRGDDRPEDDLIDTRPMKWFFAVNDVSLQLERDFWQSMILAAVRSARQHTNLAPHLLFDGDDDPFLPVLERLGVTVVRHRVSIYDALERHDGGSDYLKVASAAFLRTEIPAIEDDPFVLYTDCDVMFTGDVSLGHYRPHKFACAPEFQEDDYADFNTGVMVMNVKGLRDDLDEFTAFIRGNLSNLQAYDQGAYRMFYEGRVDPLDPVYNWKPYWGTSRDARIIHFHGVKPRHVEGLVCGETLPPVLRNLYDRNPVSYQQYVEHWTTLAGHA